MFSHNSAVHSACNQSPATDGYIRIQYFYICLHAYLPQQTPFEPKKKDIASTSQIWGYAKLKTGSLECNPEIPAFPGEEN